MYKTTFAKLPKEQIELILTYNFNVWHEKLKDVRYKEKPLCAQNVTSLKLEKEEMIEMEKFYEENSTDFQSNKVMSGLFDKITQILKENSNFEYFIRLSSRSPKDALGGIRPCSSAFEVLRTLCQSNRVSNDILWYVNYKIETPLYIHFVPWITIKTENEVRCFIYKKKLVAITHYYLLKHFSMDEKKVKDVNEMIDYIKDDVPYDDYVIDVIVSDSLYIVEFNAYGKKGTTGAVLFDWEKDEKILLDENREKICVRYQKGDDIIEKFFKP